MLYISLFYRYYNKLRSSEGDWFRLILVILVVHIHIHITIAIHFFSLALLSISCRETPILTHFKSQQAIELLVCFIRVFHYSIAITINYALVRGIGFARRSYSSHSLIIDWAMNQNNSVFSLQCVCETQFPSTLLPILSACYNKFFKTKHFALHAGLSTPFLFSKKFFWTYFIA